MKGCYRAYIKPFDDFGDYADWVEVTRDVDWGSMGQLQSGLDNTDYDIGIYRNSNFNLTLRNEHGRYNDAGDLSSIFKYKRTDSLFKLTWDSCADGGPYCGILETICGQVFIGEEMTLFQGLLSDESLAMDLSSQHVTFMVLGREGLMQRQVVPFASISAGDLASAVILACLDQAPLTSVLTVAPANISLGNDQALDSVAELENKTAKEALDALLLVTSSVLYVDENDAVIISPRTPSADVQHTFYGQAANAGVEDIQDIQKIKNGLARVFNYLAWSDSTVTSVDDSSVATYGVRKKEIDNSYFTNGVKQQSLLDTIATEWAVPKREFDLFSPLNYETLALSLLDRVAIDYPTVYTSTDALPICGVAVCGEAKLPKGIWGFQLTTSEHFKVIGRSLDVRNGLFKFRLREV